MSKVNLKALSTSDLLLLFEKLCVEQYNALDRQEYAAFNRRYDRIQAIEDELKSRPGDQRRILMTLFGHPNMQVRLTAARANLAVDYPASRREIQHIADSKWGPQCLDAGMTLINLDNGIYRPS
ncbi:MAG TPA: DUF2019 domain-containing protein [Bosea sp. (in: a-proteobacteria)]|jgi:hypothetical protein|uniref:DUF2019 domain-containing protein n=1 Tax=Bosea sp. (in: a-proteobacteria) TaxID=1871050 RepID=UPI002DDDA257|nr:DUF2019 domain-containing protein [Bosea sp. (in: a-proteobacteria)]HEV2553974.1 DUF2019 domain-containing protein [Bosea sp. (in: a-proteobacteria)]